MTKIAAFWQDFIDLLFPRCCEACHRSLSGNEDLLCTSCRLTLPRMSRASTGHELITLRFAGYGEVAGAGAYLRYARGGKVQALVHALKYKGRHELGLLLGRMYGKELALCGEFPDADLIVPVPLHRRKLKERGFNQSQSFAEGLADVQPIPVDPTLLHRAVHTASQTGKSKAERIANVTDIFRVRNGVDLRGKKVILVDDVLTTGATLESCVQTLAKNGCRHIHIMTIAAAQS